MLSINYSCCTYVNHQAKFDETRLVLQTKIILTLLYLIKWGDYRNFMAQ